MDKSNIRTNSNEINGIKKESRIFELGKEFTFQNEFFLVFNYLQHFFSWETV